jgi:hypothetical protein
LPDVCPILIAIQPRKGHRTMHILIEPRKAADSKVGRLAELEGLERSHLCRPVALETGGEDRSGSVHFVERCACGQVRHSERWPWGELSVGEWVRPTE